MMVNESGENAHDVKKMIIAALEALVHAVASEIVQHTGCDSAWHRRGIIPRARITKWLRGAAVAARKRLQNVSASDGGGRSSGIRQG